MYTKIMMGWLSQQSIAISGRSQMWELLDKKLASNYGSNDCMLLAGSDSMALPEDIFD